jgi:hypothetical protein
MGVWLRSPFAISLEVNDELRHLQENLKGGQFPAQRSKGHQKGGHALLEQNRQDGQAGVRLQSERGRKGSIQLAGGDLGCLHGADHAGGGAVSAIQNDALEAVTFHQSATVPAHGLHSAQDQQSAAGGDGGGGGDKRFQCLGLCASGGNGQRSVANFDQPCGRRVNRGAERIVTGGAVGCLGGDAAGNLGGHLLNVRVDELLEGSGGDLPVAFFVGHGSFPLTPAGQHNSAYPNTRILRIMGWVRRAVNALGLNFAIPAAADCGARALSYGSRPVTMTPDDSSCNL